MPHLKPQQIREYRTKAHSLRPVVMLGNKGLTDNVLAEIETALDHHELIKVKVVAERDERKTIAQEIARTTHAEVIQEIGQMIVFYRKTEE